MISFNMTLITNPFKKTNLRRNDGVILEKIIYDSMFLGIPELYSFTLTFNFTIVSKRV